MSALLLGLGVFLLTATEEWLAVRRVRAVVGTRPGRAALWCMAYAGALVLALQGALGTPILIGAYILGSGAGGWLAVRYRR
jgi:hypothetical protein